jgi:soluble lytic murein transglycosylase
MIARILRKKRTYAIILICFLLVLFYTSDWLGRWMYPIRYEETIHHAAELENVDPYLISAIIRVESNYEPDKVSKKGALGLMQIMPGTAEWVANSAGYESSIVHLLHEPELNIDIGTKYVRILLNQFADVLGQRELRDDQIAIIAAAYNAGPGKVSTWLQNGDWTGAYADSSLIPYGETRHFVQRVQYYYKKYEQYYSE